MAVGVVTFFYAYFVSVNTLKTHRGISFGTINTPLIHNILTIVKQPQFHCSIHLVVNHITTENLQTTHDIPITITRRNFSITPIQTHLVEKFISNTSRNDGVYHKRIVHHSSEVISDYKNSQTNRRNNIFQKKGWNCEWLILYFNPHPSDLAKNTIIHSYAMSNWIRKQTVDFIEFKLFSGNYDIGTFHKVVKFVEYFVLVIPNYEVETFRNKFDQVPFYIPITYRNPILPVTKFGVMFLQNPSNNDSILVCIHRNPAIVTSSDNFYCNFYTSLSPEMFRDQVLDTNWETRDPKQNSVDVTRILHSLQSVTNYILETSLKKTNGTLKYFPVQENCGAWPFKTRCIHPSVSTTASLTTDVFDSNILFTHYLTYAYISCYREAKLSFELYTDPFQWPLWLAIGITLMICTVLVDSFTKFVLKLNSTTSFLFFLGGLLEETSSLPSDLQKKAAFKVSIGPCILFTMILSQAYTSLVINGLNAPLALRKYDTVEKIQDVPDECGRVDKDVVHFEGIMFKRYKYSYSVTSTLHEKRNHCFAILSELRYPPHNTMSFSYNRFLINFINNRNQEQLLSTSRKIFVNFFRNLGRRFVPRKLLEMKAGTLLDWNERARNANIAELNEEEITSCENSIYVEEKEKLVFYKGYLQKYYPAAKTYLSLDTIDEYRFEGWQFRLWEGSRIPRFFKVFQESGLYNYFKVISKFTTAPANHTKSILARYPERGQAVRKVNALNMLGSIQTMFIIWSVLLMGAILIFGAEWCCSNGLIVTNRFIESCKYARYICGIKCSRFCC